MRRARVLLLLLVCDDEVVGGEESAEEMETTGDELSDGGSALTKETARPFCRRLAEAGMVIVYVVRASTEI